MKKLFYMTLLLLLSHCVASKNAVYPLSYEKHFEKSILFYLPKTDVVVVAQAQQIIERPGPFYKYAERYLGITDVVSRSRNVWSLASVNLEQQAVADTTKGYRLVYDNKKVLPMLTLSSDRVIQGVNLPSQQTCRVVGSASENRVELAADTAIRFDLSLLGEEALQANSVPKMAEMAAKQIYLIREARLSYLTGEAETLPDGVALEQILSNMQRVEEELVALFVGKRVVRLAQARYVLNLTEEVHNRVAFRLSNINGLLDANDLMGSPVYISVRSEVPMEPVSEQPKKRNKVTPTGFPFNVPGAVTIVITNHNNVVLEQRLVLPQFGTVQTLPLEFWNKNNINLLYNPSLGTIEQLVK